MSSAVEVRVGAGWGEPSPSDFDRWQELVDAGTDPSKAARDLGFRGSTRFRRADPVRHAEVVHAWREQQASEDRTLARTALRRIAQGGESEAAIIQASNSLLKMHAEMPDEEGDVGPRVPTMDGRRVAGIGDVIRLAADLGIVVGIGRLAGDAGGDVPAPAALLPAAADGVAAAGVVAADDAA